LRKREKLLPRFLAFFRLFSWRDWKRSLFQSQVVSSSWTSFLTSTDNFDKPEVVNSSKPFPLQQSWTDQKSCLFTVRHLNSCLSPVDPFYQAWPFVCLNKLRSLAQQVSHNHFQGKRHNKSRVNCPISLHPIQIFQSSFVPKRKINHFYQQWPS